MRRCKTPWEYLDKPSALPIADGLSGWTSLLRFRGLRRGTPSTYCCGLGAEAGKAGLGAVAGGEAGVAEARAATVARTLLAAETGYVTAARTLLAAASNGPVPVTPAPARPK